MILIGVGNAVVWISVAAIASLVLSDPAFIRPVQQVKLGRSGVEVSLQLRELLWILIDHLVTKAFFHTGQLMLKLNYQFLDLLYRIFIKAFELFRRSGAGPAPGSGRPTLSGAPST